VTSSPPCWKTITKDFSLASFVYGTNMAAMSLSLDSLGNDCKPRIGRLANLDMGTTTGNDHFIEKMSSSPNHKRYSE
jgi:hypothetical protein